MHRKLAAVRWDALAPIYDLQLALERPALQAALELADAGPTDRFLDVATGTGAVLHALAKRSPRPAEAVGIDESLRMLARAGDLPEGWSTFLGDARALPFPDQRFDVAVTSYLLHLLEPRARATVLTELRRVLAPRGRLVTVTPVAPPTWFGRLLERVAGRHLLDPRDELDRAGFSVRATRYVRAGYPSLCVLAHREANELRPASDRS